MLTDENCNVLDCRAPYHRFEGARDPCASPASQSNVAVPMYGVYKKKTICNIIETSFC